jgi:hypothetical protein
MEKPECWWCRQRPAGGVSDFPMCRVLTANYRLEIKQYGGAPSPEVTPTIVSLPPLSVPIPICRQCVHALEEATCKKHLANTVAWVGGVALFIAGFALTFVTKTAWSFIVGIIAFSVWAAGSNAIGDSVARRRLAQSGTARYKAGADYPAVIEQKKLGWTPGQGP